MGNKKDDLDKTLKIASAVKNIMYYAATGSMLIGSIIFMPSVLLWHPLKKIIDELMELGYSEQEIKRKLKGLEGRNFIEINLKNQKIKLKNKGKKRLEKILFENYQITRHPWDNIWRVVIFDIPEKYRYARNVFRRKLYNLGFKRIQKSVFIIPYKCLEELGKLCNYYKINKYVLFFEVKSFEGDSIMKKQFNL